MDKYNKLAFNTIVLAIGQFSSRFLVFIMMRFFTQTLGGEGYAAINLINITSMLIISVFTITIGESTIRFGLDEKANKSQVFSISLLTNLVGLLVLTPFIPLFGFFIDNIYLIFIYVITASLHSTCTLYVRSTGFVKLFAFNGIFNTVINIVLNIVLLKVFELGILGYVLAVVFADLSSIIFLFFMADLKRHLQFFGLDKHLRSAMYRFCIPMIPTQVTWWLIANSGSYFVKEIINQSALGLFAAANKLPLAIAIVSGFFSQAWNMAAITEKNSRTVAKFYTDVFSFFSSVIYVITASILLVLKPLLNILAPGEEFSTAYLYTPILIMAVIFLCFSTFMGSVYLALKKPVRSTTTALSGAVLNIILNFTLIPLFGLYGASFAMVFSYILIFTIRAVDIRPFVYMDLKLVKMVSNLILLAGMGAVIIFTSDGTVHNISLFVLFFFVIVLNYKAGIASLKFILKNKKARTGK